MQAEVAGSSGRSGMGAGPWSGLVMVLVAPGRFLAAAADKRYVWVPYLLATLVAGALLSVTPKAAPPLPAATGAAGAAAARQPGAVAMLPGGARVASPLPLGGGSQSSMSGAELLRAMSPITQGALALATPWWSGLWRTVLLLALAGMAGLTPGFFRALGVVGYSLIPLWLGDILRVVLLVLWKDPAGEQKIRWTLDALLPTTGGALAKVLALADVFQLWHAVVLVIGFAVLTRRSAWQVSWVGLLVLGLPPALKFSLPYLNSWFGPETPVRPGMSGGVGGGNSPLGPGVPGNMMGPGGPTTVGPGGFGGPGGFSGPGGSGGQVIIVPR